MSSATILVIDDEPDLLHLVSRRLQKSGYSVLCAADGTQALRMIREHRPDVCLVDVMMPDMSGLDVLREVRSDPRIANTKMIMLTARSSPSDIEQGTALGADDYLVKPVAPAELLRSIEQQLATTSNVVLEREQVIDLSVFRDWTMNDRNVAHAIVTTFVSASEANLSSLESAIASGDIAEIERRAHSIKSQLSTFGTTRAFEQAGLVEDLAREGHVAEGYAITDLRRDVQSIVEVLQAEYP